LSDEGHTGWAAGARPVAGDAIAAGIWRGAARRLIDGGHAVLAELPLGNGRRADLVAIDRAATITIVEVKSGRADFLADRKWQAYLGFCDRFYFAVDRDFPATLLPAGEGLIVADRFAGEIVREAPLRLLSAARRKAMLLHFARLAATRLHALSEPVV
jgi:hypothetical protein